MRGHNLYDIFYGRFRSHETELLRRYIELAPRDDFNDILDAIDAFVFFDSRKKCKLLITADKPASPLSNAPDGPQPPA